jgi:hypothetical protein
MRNILFASAAISALMIGQALAQDSSGGPVDNPANAPAADEAGAVEGDVDTTGALPEGTGPSMTFASEDERMMFEDNRDLWVGFFTDDTMTTLRSEDEITSAFDAMGADTQAEIRAACDRAEQNQGNYGAITKGLCSQIGAM